MKRGLFSGKKSIFIVVVMFLLIGCIFAGIYGLVSAATSNAGKTITPPAKDGVSELGTTNNPLFILEIVPNKSYAEIGYWIPGCEPVDMTKLSLDSLAYTYQSRKFADCTFIIETKYEFEIDKTELSSGSGNWKKNDNEEKGYFQKVTNGTGTIKQEKNGSDYTYTYVGPGLGQYIWVPNSNNNGYPKDDTADKVWTSVKKYTRTKMIYTHKNTFLRDAIKVPESKLNDYKSVVITVDPTDLANSANLDLINKADIIYINGKSHDSGLVSIWTKFNKEGLTLSNPPSNFQGTNDLTWDATMAIFNRMISRNRAAIIMDLTSVYLGGASDNNAHKLCIMLLQMGPANFNRLFVATNKIKTITVNGRVTGYYVGKSGNDKTTQWDQKTFSDNGEGTKYGDLLFKNPYITSNNNTTAGEGIYTYNGDMSLLEKLGEQNSNIKDSEAVTKDAFDFYEYYDRYEKAGANPNAARRTSLSSTDAIYFILHQKFDWADKAELNILEIEPYDSFIYGSAGWEARYRKFFPYFMGTASDIHVTTMTTYDYIGKIEDINSKYDMILIGLNTGYKDITNYNDSKLSGKIYLAIGDRVTADDSLRYSGNDLTKKKLDQLKNFMLSGRPVMLANGFYTDNTRSKVSATVDKATYIYDLADVIKQAGVTVNTEQTQADYRTQFKDKIFYEGNFNSYILQRKVTDSSCSIEFANKNDSSMYPVPYSYTTKSDGSISTVNYNNSSIVKYRFRIKGSADTYAVKLFIDNNGDGQYNGSLDTLTSAKAESISGLTVKDDANNTISVNSLKPYTWYTLTRRLDDTYQGIIPWKLEVNAVANTSLRASEINYTVIKQISEASKVQINVLQVVIDAGTGSPDTNFNMQTNTTFQKFLSSVAEYKVNITFMTNQQFLSLYNSCTGDATSGKYDFLANYDMLILGFRDTCSYTNNKYANQNILDFINQGKSVIFSHDVIWDKDAGQERLYNDVLRKVMSQDRYHFTTGVSSNPQPIYYDDTANQLKTNSIKMYDDNAKLTSGNDKYWKFFTDNSNKLYWQLGKNFISDRNDLLSDKNWGSLSFMETTRVSVANRGQITQYPFKIADTIKISKTHTQYYQLDLEQTDMVVWYNLSDDGSKLNSGNNTGFYSSRENDSRNSYYIYNKGNITYTGLGHTTNLTDDEMKLFINTMISSYRVGTAKAKIIITNKDVYTGDASQQYMFISSDSDTISTTDTSQVKTITFKIEDESVVSTSDRDYYVSYYAVAPDPADSTKTIRIQLNPQGNPASTDVLPTKNIDTGGTCTVIAGKGTKLNSDNEFSIDVPLKYFNGTGKLLIEMELTAVGINEDGNVIDQKSTTQVNLITKPFFDLD